MIKEFLSDDNIYAIKYSRVQEFISAKNYYLANIYENSKEVDRIRDDFLKSSRTSFIHTATEIDSIVNVVPNLDNLPALSFFLKVSFELKRPYLSKDDNIFHLHENPLRRDKTFGLPLIPGTTWKGALRWMYGRIDNKDENDEEKSNQEECLFGSEKKKIDNESVKHRAGRLIFFPTFFDKVSVEVINPHNRKTKKGKLPIYFDSVPKGTTGIFRLLYVPFDLMGDESNSIIDKTKSDAETIVIALDELLNKYGTSAKKSSGYGAMRTTKNEIDDNLFWIKKINNNVAKPKMKGKFNRKEGLRIIKENWNT